MHNKQHMISNECIRNNDKFKIQARTKAKQNITKHE